uniref:Calponin-homology (CH) domain-containing protein n=1 Tax=Oryzias sinensis TaxID=183150 RepID=A0A8C7YG49_9TELE
TEQEAVQKRTFTKWINSHLEKHKLRLEMNDLFEDIKDGVKLLALLEVLSGQRLGRKVRCLWRTEQSIHAVFLYKAAL